MPRSTIVIVLLALLGAAGFGLAIGYTAGGRTVGSRVKSIASPRTVATADALISPAAGPDVGSPAASPAGEATPIPATPAGGTPAAAIGSPVVPVSSPQPTNSTTVTPTMPAATRSATQPNFSSVFARESLASSPIVVNPTIPSEATKWPSSDGTDGASGSVSTADIETSSFRRAEVVARGER